MVGFQREVVITYQAGLLINGDFYGCCDQSSYHLVAGLRKVGGLVI